MCKREGFTLIELLVVIAIIAILAAILFPVFTSAKAKAQQASCTSNLKQIAIGTQMYMGDSNDKFPISTWNAGNLDPKPGPWADRIYPYIKNRRIACCPSLILTREESLKDQQLKQAHQPPLIRWWNGYGFNNGGLCVWTNGIVWVSRPLSVVTWQTRTLMYGEVDYRDAMATTHACFRNWTVTPYNYSSRHSDGSNAIAVDGHAKWLSSGQLSESEKGTLWNYPN